MNKNKKIIIAGTLAAILAIGGGVALSSNNKVSAEPAAPQAGAGAAKNFKDAPPPREKGKGRGMAGNDGKGGCGVGEPGRPERPEDGKHEGAEAAASPGANAPVGSATGGNNSEQTGYTVVISSGFDTDPQDHGRPVVLIAAALGVPTEVFREAFSGVTPAGLDSGPSSELAQRNKAALLKVLAPYGITNERLDEVSNYYRYNGRKEATWKKTQASATATVTDGVVTGITITNPGAGYSSNPTVTVKGPNGTVTATATVSYSQDFKTNGSISSITLD